MWGLVGGGGGADRCGVWCKGGRQVWGFILNPKHNFSFPGALVCTPRHDHMTIHGYKVSYHKT